MKKKLFGLVLVLFIGVVAVTQVIIPQIAVKRAFDKIDKVSLPTQLVPVAVKMQLQLREERPVRPDQLDLEDMKVGAFLYEVHEEFETLILITRAPYMVEKDCLFDNVWWKDGEPWGSFVWSSYCSDFGLVEYTGPIFGWNPHNYLRYSDEDSLTLAEILGVIRHMQPEP